RVPVPAAGRQRERRAGRRAHEAPLGIEQIEQRIEVELVRSAAVQQHERPGRIALCWPDAGFEAHRESGGYFARTSSMYVAIRSASSGSEISSTFSAFCSPECERLKLPANTTSSQTVIFACM